MAAENTGEEGIGRVAEQVVAGFEGEQASILSYLAGFVHEAQGKGFVATALDIYGAGGEFGGAGGGLGFLLLVLGSGAGRISGVAGGAGGGGLAGSAAGDIGGFLVFVGYLAGEGNELGIYFLAALGAVLAGSGELFEGFVKVAISIFQSLLGIGQTNAAESL
ncbi:MAG TPA: hypothetical protein PK858_02410 [Saprospiraceae bacterium]|nr:hypothetical protein [Saprospiraceae bacterium]